MIQGETHLRITSSTPAPRAIGLDELIGAGIVRQLRWRAGQLWNDSLGENFSKLHAPLIETIHAPNCSLREHLVLVEGDQSTQHAWRKFLAQNGVGWSVALLSLIHI